LPGIIAWFYLLDEKGLHRRAFNQALVEPVLGIPVPQPIHFFQYGYMGGTTIPVGSAAAWRFLPDVGVPLDRWNPESGQFEAVSIQWLDDQSPYAAGLHLWTAWFDIFCNPARERGSRMDLIRHSRQVRVLFPLASFIVVENEAQWRMLERTEAATGDARRGLEHDEFIEAPAPGIWLLLPFAWWLSRRKSKRG
jgi:hypothetical protein